MNQMKNIIYVIVLFTLFSCEDYLDKTDPNATTFVEFFNDEGDLSRVVYSSYRDVFTNNGSHQTNFYLKDGKSDNAYSRIQSHYHQNVGNGNFNSSSRDFLFYYELHMKHLGRLNTFIANIDVPYVEDESVRQRYKSILEALRFWHYFELTFRWGDVPFTLEPADLDTARQPATPKEEILDYLFSNYENIADRLPKQEYATDKYMFNHYSFKALVMRYALYNKRYALAAKLAKEIMDSQNYELHPVYADLFNYNASSNNNEFIMHYNRESYNGSTYTFRDLGPHFRTGNGQSYVVPLKSLVDSYWTLQGETIENSTLHSKREYELNPSLNRDPRYAASIMGHGDIFYGEEIDIFNENNPMYYEKERASASGYWFKKFVDEADAFKGSGNMEYGLLRYAEVLLTYAEAKIMLNEVDGLAKSAINDVRRRAGLDMDYADVTLPSYGAYTNEQWIELIRNERRVELAGEGLRYDDIIRWEIADKVLNKPALGHTMEVNGELQSIKIEDRSFKPNNYLWPFHENTLRVNPGIKQNPGY